MATTTVPRPVDGAPTLGQESPPKDDSSLKRKASLGDSDSDSSSFYAKRQRHDDRLSPRHRRSSVQEHPQERRESATQEEKKRGKRLFGGLLSTLSQTSTNSQHKRRQEIERRQQERIQKQRDEDDQKRSEKVAKVKEARMVEHIDFEGQVMRNKHSKLLALAQFMKTKAQPAIYYLPWKRTADQEDLIDAQVRSAKATIAKEEEEFKMKRERHLDRYQPRRVSYASVETSGLERLESTDAGQHGEGRRDQELAKKDDEHKPAQHHDPHDESGDVVVEADEDTVIY
ncbi:hypothetical protein ED733_000162 [Metarhizium rileyi]|uniref:Pinin/SDK/MemA protein domain-containing protein n=1 Tax=Metarhizium rileyi (strain RCEF 4871) TaxID=1649241 RepID=A0A5C6GJ53_METRR|nr:hypothetical protein ED733_000162 [Metarhizium rileyi]